MRVAGLLGTILNAGDMVYVYDMLIRAVYVPSTNSAA